MCGGNSYINVGGGCGGNRVEVRWVSGGCGSFGYYEEISSGGCGGTTPRRFGCGGSGCGRCDYHEIRSGGC